MKKGGNKLGRVIGFELNSQDPEKAANFYSKVFAWEIAELRWDYWAVTTGASEQNVINGGIGKGPSHYPHGVRVQSEVVSINDAIAKAMEEGAIIVREKMEFDEFYLAYLVDPTGLGFALIQNKKN